MVVVAHTSLMHATVFPSNQGYLIGATRYPGPYLLEQKVDIRLIQVLLGHKKLETTALYAQVATDILREVVSPLEKLNSV